MSTTAPDLGCCEAVLKHFPSGLRIAHARTCPDRPGQRATPDELAAARRRRELDGRQDVTYKRRGTRKG